MKPEEIEAIKFNDLANDVCGKIQDGYTLNIHLENGSGWVTVSTVGMMDVLPEDIFDVETMSQMVIVATSYVNEFLPDCDELEKLCNTAGFGAAGEKAVIKAMEDAKDRWQAL